MGLEPTHLTTLAPKASVSTIPPPGQVVFLFCAQRGIRTLTSIGHHPLKMARLPFRHLRLEPRTGLEPVTSSLPRKYSTTELSRHFLLSYKYSKNFLNSFLFCVLFLFCTPRGTRTLTPHWTLPLKDNVSTIPPSKHLLGMWVTIPLPLVCNTSALPIELIPII